MTPHDSALTANLNPNPNNNPNPNSNRYAKHSAAYAEFVAGAVKITNSIIFNVPRAGIALNDAMGGGNEIAHSLIFNAVRESSDHGPITRGTGRLI